MENYTATTQQLSEILGVSDELVRLLSRQNVLPKKGRNEFDLREAVPAFYSRSNSADNEAASQYEIERTRFMKAKADTAEMAAGLMAKELERVDVIHEIYSDMILKMRAKILLIPRSLSVVPVPNDARGREIIWRNALNEALKEIANNEQPKQRGKK
jgi:phage terminase Nu1 subunit (DNA packaging protein)